MKWLYHLNACLKQRWGQFAVWLWIFYQMRQTVGQETHERTCTCGSHCYAEHNWMQNPTHWIRAYQMGGGGGWKPWKDHWWWMSRARSIPLINSYSQDSPFGREEAPPSVGGHCRAFSLLMNSIHTRISLWNFYGCCCSFVILRLAASSCPSFHSKCLSCVCSLAHRLICSAWVNAWWATNIYLNKQGHLSEMGAITHTHTNIM